MCEIREKLCNETKMKGRREDFFSTEGLLAALSFGLTCFSIGYAMGRNDNHKTQK